jgi:hypothetical protein
LRFPAPFFFLYLFVYFISRYKCVFFLFADLKTYAMKLHDKNKKKVFTIYPPPLIYNHSKLNMR